MTTTSENKVPQVKFTGLAMYPKVLPQQAQAPHPDALKDPTKAHPDDRSYSIGVECTRGLFEQLEDMGIPQTMKLKRYDDQPGKYYINIRGTKVKVWTDKKTGEVKHLNFEDPTIQDKDGNLWAGGEIGNGSLVEVIANMDKNKGTGGIVLRLHSVKVLDHVPYESKPKEFEVTLESNSGSTKAQPPVAGSAATSLGVVEKAATAGEGFF